MKTFYDIIAGQVSLEEYRYETIWPVALLLRSIAKLGVPLPGSTDDPAVESLSPFEVTAAAFPPEVKEAFAPLAQSLLDMGFAATPVCHAILDPLHKSQTYWADFPHATGQVTARLHLRYWDQAAPRLRGCFVQFVTECTDGSVVLTSAGKPDLKSPPGWHVTRQINAEPLPLLQQHHAQLKQRPTAVPVLVKNAAAVREQAERLHAQARDYHLSRGVFREIPAARQQSLRTQAEEAVQRPLVESATPIMVSAAGTHIPTTQEAIVQEMNRQAVKGSGSLWSGLLILFVSVGLFIGLGAMRDSLQFMFVLIPLLFFHEAGHYVAMKWFGYRDTKMFFIPLFGAAVTGKHFNVAGWKKAIVSLMGPAPGIALGVGLGIAAIVTRAEWCFMAAFTALFLNAFNLLPVLPLDGGWVLHSVLFSRHRWLDVAFRVAAIVGIGVLGLATGSVTTFLFLGLPMIMSLSSAYKVNQITEKIRSAGVPDESTDAVTVPPLTAARIAHEVSAAWPQYPNPMRATLGLQVYEALNSKPPSILASLAILFVHGGALVTAIVMGAVLFIGRSAGLGDFIEAAASQPQRTITVEQIETRMAAANLSADGRTITVHAQFVTSQQAQEAYRAATAQLGDESSHCRLDTTLIATFPRGMPPAAMPPAAKALQESWSRAGATAQTNDFTYCRVYGIARNETEAKELEELIQSYSFTAGRVRTALPPWSASPVEIDRETMLKARRTLVAASELPPLTDEEQQEMKRQIERVGREMRTDPNPEKSRDRSEKLFQLHAERQRKHYETLKAQGDKYDAAVLDWLASQSQPNPDVPIRDRVRPPPGVAERLGGRPGDKPPARDGTERVSVIRTGLILQLESLSFHDPAAGLPALIHWLTDRGCVDLRFDVYGDDPSDEDNADVGE